jgi:serine phosphatase RsbU (regulator of sigma subunit)
MIVAGLDARSSLASHVTSFLPSGRALIFRILMDELLTAQPELRCTIVTEDRSAYRIPRGQRSRIEIAEVQPKETIANRISFAISRRPDLLIIDRLDGTTAIPAADAANAGIRVLTQLDTIFYGPQVAHQLINLGLSEESLSTLAWIVSVQRLNTLCPNCKQPTAPSKEQVRRLQFTVDASAYEKHVFFDSPGCEHCRRLGRMGDVALFDIFMPDHTAEPIFSQASTLPMDHYLLRLARDGQLSIADYLDFKDRQLRGVFQLFQASEQELADVTRASQSKLLELEAANRVLNQRTEALVSLQEIGQALTTSENLDDMAARLCRRVRDLCGVDRAILYYQRSAERVEILGVTGWDAELVHYPLDSRDISDDDNDPEPRPFNRIPPGIPARHSNGVQTRAGLYLPLVAQEKRVGLMIVHTQQKARFAPGEVSLLQTYASQAALALQRAGLIDTLRAKIALLEAAQMELVHKERLEQEMLLARQVQQSVLPRTFPQVTGVTFAARNEPARQVGGDLYDVIDFGDGRIGLAVADVSDKGMPAALYMALTRSLLRAVARYEDTPVAVVSRLNQLLIELGEPNMFVTLFYAVLEPASRKLVYTRAGHDRPVLLRDGSGQELGGRGVALGLLDQTELNLTEEQLLLAPGDRLVLFTDGMVDVLAPDGSQLVRDQLQEMLERHADLHPQALCDAVFEDLAEFRGNAEQYDDMTLLVLEVR